MNFLEFKRKLDNFYIFSLNDILKVDNSFNRRRLYEWQQKGHLINVRRGFYIFSDYTINEDSLFLIANVIYDPSYISLETALSRYGLIPETVYAITSVSTKKTESFKTEVGNFDYKHIKASLYFGYNLIDISGRTYLFASIEKCVLDYIYLHPELIDLEAFAAWRFHASSFLEQADLKKFDEYLKAFNSKALVQRVNIFKKYIGI